MGRDEVKLQESLLLLHNTERHCNLIYTSNTVLKVVPSRWPLHTVKSSTKKAIMDIWCCILKYKHMVQFEGVSIPFRKFPPVVFKVL